LVECEFSTPREIAARMLQGFVLAPELYSLCTDDASTAPESHLRVRVTLQLTVSQSACLGVEPRWGLMTRYSFLLESYCPVHVGHPL
jgi:hypothetical protein